MCHWISQKKPFKLRHVNKRGPSNSSQLLKKPYAGSLPSWCWEKWINSLTPGSNFKSIIFKLVIKNSTLGIHVKLLSGEYHITSLMKNEKSILALIMAWCCQATSHYVSQCWPILSHNIASLGAIYKKCQFFLVIPKMHHSLHRGVRELPPRWLASWVPRHICRRLLTLGRNVSGKHTLTINGNPYTLTHCRRNWSYKYKRTHVSIFNRLQTLKWCMYSDVSRIRASSIALHDGVIKWKLFSRYWPLVRGIHRPVMRTLMFIWRGSA